MSCHDRQLVVQKMREKQVTMMWKLVWWPSEQHENDNGMEGSPIHVPEICRTRNTVFGRVRQLQSTQIFWYVQESCTRGGAVATISGTLLLVDATFALLSPPPSSSGASSQTSHTTEPESIVDSIIVIRPTFYGVQFFSQWK